MSAPKVPPGPAAYIQIIRLCAVIFGLTRVVLAASLLIAGCSHEARVRVAGLRIATVTVVWTATIEAAIGAGGPGMFIFRGSRRFDRRYEEFSTGVDTARISSNGRTSIANRVLRLQKNRFNFV
jgi:hypothetical protein